MLLQNLLAGHRLVLASASPRRRQLLAGLDIEFLLAEPFECEEDYPADLPVVEVAEYLSRLKSNVFPHRLEEGDVLLTADTTVLVGDAVLGKPADRADAVAMLGMLSGRSHMVVTGVTLRSAGKVKSFSVCSTVHFRALDDDEIAYYVEKYSPLDKAGAYGIQEWVGYAAIEGIEGSFYNVMGLPVQRLYTELVEFLK